MKYLLEACFKPTRQPEKKTKIPRQKVTEDITSLFLYFGMGFKFFIAIVAHHSPEGASLFGATAGRQQVGIQPRMNTDGHGCMNAEVLEKEGALYSAFSSSLY
ncbi:MAG: hypothetical protein JJU05_05965 [Verrucomicrobia bacterium]|nr:hypothetical protein [Verrucomicrobiota bacterium]